MAVAMNNSGWNSTGGWTESTPQEKVIGVIASSTTTISVLNVTMPATPTELCNGTQLGYTCIAEEFIAYVYIIPSICVVGVLCNLLNFVVLTAPQMHGSSYTYLTAMAVADFLTSLIVLPIGVVRCSLGLEYLAGVDMAQARLLAHAYNIYLRYVFLPVNNVSGTTSVLLTLVIGLERYMFIKMPARGKVYCTPRIARRVVIVTTLVALGINVHYFAQAATTSFGPAPCFTVTNSWIVRTIVYQILSWNKAVMAMLLPSVVLLLINFVMSHELRVRTRQLAAMSATSPAPISPTSPSSFGGQAQPVMSEARRRRRSAQNRLTATLICIVCLYLVGNVPVVFAFPGIAGGVFGANFAKKELYLRYRLAANILVITSFALNFFVYYACNEKFKKTLCEMCTRCRSPTISNVDGSDGVHRYTATAHTVTVGGGGLGSWCFRWFCSCCWFLSYICCRQARTQSMFAHQEDGVSCASDASPYMLRSAAARRGSGMSMRHEDGHDDDVDGDGRCGGNHLVVPLDRRHRYRRRSSELSNGDWV